MNWLHERIPDWNNFCYTMHFFFSAVIVLLCHELGLNRLQSVSVAVLIGVLKEVYDVVIAHKAMDLNDEVCNLIGVFVGWLLVL